MTVVRNETAFSQIFKLLSVIFFGVFGAMLLAWGMIHYYGASGSFNLRQVLLSPDVVSKLSYPEINRATGRKEGYHFERVEFLYFNDASREWKRKQLDLQTYHELFDQIVDDKSVTLISEELQTSFQRENPAILSIVMIKDKEAGEAEKAMVFQEVQIASTGDFYRVQLREEGGDVRWAYFYHPGLYYKILQIAERNL